MKYFTATILITLLFAGYSKGQAHAAPSEKKQPQQTQNAAETPAPAVKTVTLEKLLIEPKIYAGQEVAVKGIFHSICCPSDFILKEGFDSIEVVVSEMPPKSKIGSRIRVKGTVVVRGKSVSILAKEVTFE